MLPILWNNTKAFGFAFLIAMVIRTFLFEAHYIPSGSMKPGLLLGDCLFVSKYHYGYSRYSLPFSPPLFEGRMMQSHQPERGDVVVFSEQGVRYIKRLIGLPGDRIEVKHGVVYVNNIALPQERDGDFYDEELHTTLQQYTETIGEKSHIILDHHHTRVDNTPAYDVPAHHYFMMGDNRDHSNDSRGSLGMIHEDHIIGRAEILFFSLECPWWQIWNWPWGVRWDRIFTLIR